MPEAVESRNMLRSYKKSPLRYVFPTAFDRMRHLFFLLLLFAAPAALAREFRSIGENATPMYDAPSVKANKLFVATRF
jgi:hypothetical protein